MEREVTSTWERLQDRHEYCALICALSHNSSESNFGLFKQRSSTEHFILQSPVDVLIFVNFGYVALVNAHQYQSSLQAKI